MKKLKKYFIMLAAMAFAMVLTACGGSMKTDISLKSDKTGTRVMTYTANLEENAGKYNGNIPDITDAVKNACPADLSFSDKSTDEDVIYEFTLSFTSIDDYNKKVNNILEAGGLDKVNEPIIAEAPDSIFATGVKYYENFNADDLLAWFENCLVENGYVEEGNKSDIIGSNNFTYNIMGVSGETSYMNVDTVKYLRLDGVNVYTTINGNGTFDRKIDVLVPEASMSERGDDIKAFMESVTVAGSDGHWKQGEGQQIYSISIEQADESKINEMMNAFCGTTGEKLFTVGESKSQKGGVFSDSKHISDTYQMVNYVTGSYNELQFGYFVMDRGVYEGKVTLDSESRDIKLNGNGSDSYVCMYSSYYDFNFTYDYDYTNKFDLGNASIEVKPLWDGQVKRTVELDYVSEFSEEKIEEIKTKIDDAIAKALNEASMSSNKGDMKLKKCEATDGGLKVVIETKADAAFESTLWNVAFDGNCTFGLASSSKAFMPLTRVTSVDDCFDMGMFAGSEIPNVTYTIKGIGKTTTYGGNPERQKGNNYVATYTDLSPSRLYVSATGKMFNIITLAVWIVGGLAACAAIAFALLMILKKAKEKKANAPAPAVNPAFAQQPMQPQMMPGMQPVPDMNVQQQMPVQPAVDMNAPQMPVQPAVDMNAPQMPVQPVADMNAQPVPADAVPNTQAGVDATVIPPTVAAPQEMVAPSKVFCTNCGSELAPGSVFCTSCGNKIG